MIDNRGWHTSSELGKRFVPNLPFGEFRNLLSIHGWN
jgi:hypothetical protein